MKKNKSFAGIRNIILLIILLKLAFKDNSSPFFIQAGGGIVFDSVVDNEFQETVNKAGACMNALRMTAEEE